ncbi:sensor histidine kinase [Paenibacillus sp. GYB004]|uniref:cache domain-containing sensor histidine kinase n=1 Tax=Paenibacillus sp. GYB004 TaxID=2994393 RepID=UPI002F9681F1
MTKKRAGWFYSLSIKQKMIVVFLSFSFIVVISMGVSSNWLYSNSIEDDFVDLSEEAAERISYHLDYYINQLQRSTRSLIQNDILQTWLVSDEVSNEDAFQVELEIRRYLALNYSEIQGIFLLSPNKPIVSMSQSFGRLESLENEPWFRMPIDREKHILTTHEPSYNPARGQPVISVLLPIYSKSTLDLVGRLAVDISLQELRNTLNRTQFGKNGVFFLITDDHTIIYHPQESWNGSKKEQTGLKELEVPQSGEAKIQRIDREKFLIASHKSTITGWNIVTVVPFSELARGLKSATASMYIVLAAIFILIALVVPLLSNYFIRPIIQLKRMILQVATGNLQVQSVPIEGGDEIQQLHHSFNMMVGKLDDLIDKNFNLKLQEVQLQLKQKEALIKALQNQINPHLLYNTLGIIKSIAYLEKVPIIEKMAKNLSDMYRYTASFSDTEVTLRDELNHLEKYLDIIHVRFPIRFQSRIYVNSKYFDCRLVKLVLQPIVENAVKYAIEPNGGEGTIIISAYTENDFLVIEIADNGEGFGDEELARIQSQLQHISNHIDHEFVQDRSLGISNVHARLVLKYGKQCGIEIFSLPGKGAVVSVRVPIAVD